MQANAGSKPNVVILFADDISAREFPIYGSSVWSLCPVGGNTSDSKYRAFTPVMDRISKKGVFFKTAWASTICSPSRAMMMTGRYAHLHKWWHLKDKGTWVNEKGKKETYPLKASSPYSLGTVAHAAGYATMWAGKTQMDYVEELGFDEGAFTPGFMDDGSPYTDFNIVSKKVNGKSVLINEDTGDEVEYYAQSGWYWKPNVQLMNHPGSKKPIEWWPNTPESKAKFGLNTYGPDVELDFIFDFITRKVKEKQPFFVYHTSHLGHDGWDFLNRDINPETRNKWPATPKIEWKDGKYYRTEPNITGDKGNYNTHGSISEPGIFSHINYIDYQIWLYLNKFKELGIDNNTVFIIAADNGTSGYGKGIYQSQKGVHVPLLIYAPCMHMTKKGAQDPVVNITDILPTVAELEGVEFPADYELNGKSLVPYLTTQITTHRPWIYSFHLDKQLIRGTHVMIDGYNKVYDVTSYPADLISFPEIKDWSKFPSGYKAEYDSLLKVLPRYDLYKTEHNAPEGGIGKVSPLILD